MCDVKTADVSFDNAVADIKSYPFTLVGVDEAEAKKCADKDDTTTSVSYTHLDVYKRQVLNEVSYFGPGAREVLPQEINRLGLHKAFVSTDKDLLKFGVADKV